LFQANGQFYVIYRITFKSIFWPLWVIPNWVRPSNAPHFVTLTMQLRDHKQIAMMNIKLTRGHINILLCIKNWGSSVSIATTLSAGRPRFSFRPAGAVKEFFLFVTASSPAARPNRLQCSWVQGALSPGVKRPGCQADHSPPSSAEVKNAWSYTYTSQYIFMAYCLIKQGMHFHLMLRLRMRGAIPILPNTSSWRVA
jgi:hypothetical protein